MDTTKNELNVYKSSYDISGNTINVGLTYIAPQFVPKQKTSEKMTNDPVFSALPSMQEFVITFKSNK